MMNGCTGVSAVGMAIIIGSCSQTLLDFEGACNDQPEMNNKLLEKLAVCWNLENLDLTGCVNLDDQGFVMLSKGEAHLRTGLPPTLPGLIKLITCKLGNTKITDFGLVSLIKVTPNL